MNKVFKKVLNRSTGQFIVVSENAKCSTKSKAKTQGAISNSENAQSNLKKLFKATSIAVTVAFSTSATFAAQSNLSDDVGSFLTEIYSSFENNTNKTLTAGEIQQLDDFYSDRYGYEIEGIYSEYRDHYGITTVSARDVFEFIRQYNYDLSNDGNFDAGWGSSWSIEGTGLTTYGVQNNNFGVANVVAGIQNNITGSMNNAVGSELNVTGDHNVVIGTNASTHRDAGGDVLNLQVLERNQVDLNDDYTSFFSNILNDLYESGKITLEQYVANASYSFGPENEFVNAPAIDGSYNTVMGSYNDVTGDKNTLIGNSNTVAKSNNATIVGNTNVSNGNDNTFVGSGNFVTGNNNTVIGSNDISAFNAELARINKTVYANESAKKADLAKLAGSYGSYITGNNIVAIGTKLDVKADNSVVIGNNVTSSVSGATVIGNNLVVDGTIAGTASYITNEVADNIVMFGGQRFTQILDGENPFDGVALQQIGGFASGYYQAHNNLMSSVEALNLNSEQDAEKLFKEVALRIDTIKNEDKIKIQEEIDLGFAEKTSGTADSTLTTTMKGVETTLSEFAKEKYTTLRSQALGIANAQDKQLNSRVTESLNASQQQALDQLNAKLDGKKSELAKGLEDITSDKKQGYLSAADEAIQKASDSKKNEALGYIKAEDESRLSDSSKLIDELIANSGTSNSNGATSNTGLGSQAGHYDNLLDYAADQDTVLLQNTKDKTDNLVYQSKEDKQTDIDSAIKGQVDQAIDTNKALDDSTKNQLTQDMAQKDADILSETNKLTKEIIAENTAVTRDLITLQDQVTLNSIKDQTDANNAKTLTDLNSNFDALDKVVLDSGKNAITNGDKNTYENLEKYILVQDELVASKSEKIIKDLAESTETNTSIFITAADEAIWEEFQKHLGTGGGVTDEASAIDYAANQDAKNLATLKLLADAKDLQVLQSAKDYADSKFNNISDRIASRDAKIQAGVAGAYALSSLPQASYPGQAGTAWAMSSKGGQSAVAVGYTMMTDDSKYLIKSGIARDSKSKFSGGASVTRYILPQ